MGTSRGPIREAIRVLSGMGLVTAVPNRGVFVRQVSVPEMLDIYEIRALIFGFAVERAAEHLTPARSRILAALIEPDGNGRRRRGRAAATTSSTCVSTRRSSSSRAIGARRGSTSECVNELHLFRRPAFNFAAKMRRSNIEHRAILAAMAAGRSAEARAHRRGARAARPACGCWNPSGKRTSNSLPLGGGPGRGFGEMAVIREIGASDLPSALAIINDAAQAYRGVIPPDRWHEPYMPAEELAGEIADGVRFWVAEEDACLVGVMGIQDRGEVALIRHAYVAPAAQGKGVGSRLLAHLEALTAKPILIGTWADASWAIAFYRRHGFATVSTAEKERLLRRYWSIPERQIETSVVLADRRWREG